jgi:hypothetical protein
LMTINATWMACGHSVRAIDSARLRCATFAGANAAAFGPAAGGLHGRNDLAAHRERAVGIPREQRQGHAVVGTSSLSSQVSQRRRRIL